MDTIYLFVRSTDFALARLSLSLLKGCWSVLLDWHVRAQLRARLWDLSDAELRDIGITRGEIEYVVCNRSEEPRGAVSPP
jgi:uncharacterized protein YjiS (DUF1127 family)